MALPVGVVTRPLAIGRPFDTVGNLGTVKITVEPQWGGTTQALIWAATGDPWEVIPVVPTAQTDPDGDPYETIDLPVVDQSGWLDGSGNEVTNWNYRVTTQATFTVNGFKSKLKARSKPVSPLSTWSAVTPQDFELLHDGTSADPHLATLGAVTSVAGLVGTVITAENLAAALGNLLMRFVAYGTDATMARPTGTAPVFWIGDPAVEPVHQTSADYRIPTA